ncbi:MAG TPA: hypothetical protein VFD16_00125 [Candidatus Saccharimonadales bacterium]|nr:hypothetical protein [Candidatus Saccharimonadales bacterium]
MKKIVRIALKVILAIIFLQNIGFFSFISTMPAEKQAPIKADLGRADNQYLNEKIDKAENLGDNYGPEEYFADLTEIRLKTKNNDFDRYALLNVNYTINVLMARMNENVTRHRKSDSDEGYGQYMKQLSAAQQKCLNITDPEAQKREAEFKIKSSSPTFWQDTFISFLIWFLGFYLKNLPLALVLLWTWWYERKNKISINNPLSFLICLIFYPIVIVRTWIIQARTSTRTFAMSVDLKRRKSDIFSLISENELADIKRFAISDLKIGDYRDYLKNRGLSYQHALMPAMIATFIMLLVSPSMAYTTKNQSADYSKCQVCIKAPPDFQHHDSSQNGHDLVVVIPLTTQKKMFIMTLTWELVLPPAPKRRPGFQTNPDPIPLVA